MLGFGGPDRLNDTLGIDPRLPARAPSVISRLLARAVDVDLNPW